MEQSSANQQQKKREWILAGCEQNRQQCNKLSSEERQRLREKSIYFARSGGFLKPAAQ